MIKSNGRAPYLGQEWWAHSSFTAEGAHHSHNSPRAHLWHIRQPGPNDVPHRRRLKCAAPNLHPHFVVQRAFLNNKVHSAVPFAAVSGLPHPLSAHNLVLELQHFQRQPATLRLKLSQSFLVSRMICSMRSTRSLNFGHPPFVPASLPASVVSSSPDGQQTGDLAQHAVTSAMASSMYSRTVEAAHLPMNWIIQTDQPCRAYRLAPDRRGLCPVGLSFCDVATPQASTSCALAAREPSTLGKNGLVPPSSFSSHTNSKRKPRDLTVNSTSGTGVWCWVSHSSNQFANAGQPPRGTITTRVRLWRRYPESDLSRVRPTTV